MLATRAQRPDDRPMEQIVLADLGTEPHRDALLLVLSQYVLEPDISGSPLPASVRDRVVDALREHPTTQVLLAFDGERPLGMAVCFVSFSTFSARRALNVHDLAVLAEARGRGLGRRLLAAAEERARALDCCKLTLEVREDNRVARALYRSFGFGRHSSGEPQVPTFFLEKPLAS
jgi:ribosomal protein S18 acetylase RimI-like enzyme